MENQETVQEAPKKVYTREEVIQNLQNQIELQKMHTELQELKTRAIYAVYKEIELSIQLDNLSGKEQAPEQAEMQAEFEKAKETPERKLKQESK